MDKPNASVAKRDSGTIASKKRTSKYYAGSATKLEGKHQKAQSAWSAWQKEWSEFVAPLGLPPDTSPERASAVTDELRAVLEQDQQIAALERRVQGLEAEISDFEREVSALGERWSPELVDLPFESAWARAC